MKSRVFEFSFVLFTLYQSVSATLENKGALQESFVVNLKKIKNECEANIASLLSVIEDLQQNVNTSLIQDLKEETQSLKKLVEVLNKTVQEQQNTIEEQRRVIQRVNESTLSIDEVVYRRLDKLEQTPDIHFTVRLSSDVSVPIYQTVKFDSVVTNVGGGYIDNSSHADYGKFMAPVSGTYQFLVTITSSNMATGETKINLVVNGTWIVNIEVKYQEQVGTCHLVENLNKGDKVWVTSAVHDTNDLKNYATFFSGHLIPADNV